MGGEGVCVCSVCGCVCPVWSDMRGGGNIGK